MWTSIDRYGWVFLMMLVPAWSVHAGALPDPPVPPETHVADVSERMVYNGVDMHVRVFRSPSSQAEVVAFYRKAWGKGAVVNRVGDAMVVGHKVGDYVVTVQVSGFAGGSKGTIGILDTASSRGNFVPGKGLPAPMGAKVFNDISYPDDTVPARTVAMRDGLSPRQNVAYFNERLLGQGWKPAAGNNRCDTGDSCVLRFTRGDSKMTLMVMKAESGGGQSQVVIHVQNPEVSP